MLTADDWLAVEFYQRVSDQYINQTPMGTSDKSPPYLSIRLEGYHAALQLYGYPRWIWPWLIRWAQVLHAYVHELDAPDWFGEFGCDKRRVKLEELI